MYIVYRGPSQLDGSPVVVLVNGITRPSANVKTGPMAQAYVLRDDMPPIEARRTGGDISICGYCPHRAGSCYVQIEQAVRGIYKAYQRGAYQPLSPADLTPILNALGRPYRMTAYGDPTAVPFEVWKETLNDLRAGYTGYVHGWRDCDPRFKEHFMASVETPSEALQAQYQGWRTFRVRSPDEPHIQGERLCPASEEAGKQLQCVTCMACDGAASSKASGILVNVHGSPDKRNTFNKLKAAGKDTYANHQPPVFD